jgi:hypothetical protein
MVTGHIRCPERGETREGKITFSSVGEGFHIIRFSKEG